MACLYANERFPQQVVGALRGMVHDVLTTVEASRANQELSGAAVLTFATREGCAVLTLNCRDFIRLHCQQPDHAGIIVCA